MSEIKVGEYIRTFNGNIFKIIGGNSDNYDIDIDYWKLEATEENWIKGMEYNDNGYFFYEKYKNIKKHSFNIIDIIEVGDYVNGEKVICFRNENCNYDIGVQYCDDYGEYFGFNKEEIRTIVTKERFEESEYKVC